MKLAAAVLASAFAVTLSACGVTTAADDEKAEAPPPRALPATECLEAAGATVVSADDFGGQILTVVAEAPGTSTRLVIGMSLEMYSIEQGEEFTIPAEASVTLGSGATEEDKAVAAECAKAWESTERRRGGG